MNEAIGKAQYMLKAKPMFFLFSKLNFIHLLLAYFMSDTLYGFITSYIAMVLLSYKFLFSKTRMDNPYKIFLLHHISNFIKNTRSNK